MTLDPLFFINDLIEQPPPTHVLSALRAQLDNHTAAVEKTRSILTTWDAVDTEQATRFYFDLANRYDFQKHVKTQIAGLLSHTITEPLAVDATTLLAANEQFGRLCRQTGRLCQKHMRPFAPEKTACFHMPIVQLPDLLEQLKDSIAEQQTAEAKLNDDLIGKKRLSDRQLATAALDVQFNLQALDDFRTIFKRWYNISLTSEQQTQVMAAIGIIDTLTVGTYRIQSFCQLIKAARDSGITQRPVLN